MRYPQDTTATRTDHHYCIDHYNLYRIGRFNTQRDCCGGGRVLRNYLSGSNDYGEIADKFYTVRFLRAVGDGVTTASNFLWDSYTRGYNLQLEAQFKETQMISEVSPRIIHAGLKEGTKAVIATSVGNAIYNTNTESNPKVIAYVAIASFAGGFVAGASAEIWEIFMECIN